MTLLDMSCCEHARPTYSSLSGRLCGRSVQVWGWARRGFFFPADPPILGGKAKRDSLILAGFDSDSNPLKRRSTELKPLQIGKHKVKKKDGCEKEGRGECLLWSLGR